MILEIPSEEKAFIKQIWKIIGLQSISKEDLIYRISYKMNLPFRPSEISRKLKNGITKGYLIQEGRLLKLSEEIMTDLIGERDFLRINHSKIFPFQNKWDRIEDNYDSWKENLEKNVELDDKLVMEYTGLIRNVFSKEEIQKGRRLDRGRVHYRKIDLFGKRIEGVVDGSNGERYTLTIDLKNKIIIHNCEDFIRNKMSNQEFCKHFYHYLNGLKTTNFGLGKEILESLDNNRRNWKFKSLNLD